MIVEKLVMGVIRDWWFAQGKVDNPYVGEGGVHPHPAFAEVSFPSLTGLGEENDERRCGISGRPSEEHPWVLQLKVEWRRKKMLGVERMVPLMLEVMEEVISLC